MNVLDRIIAYKRDEVAAAKRDLPLANLEALARDQAPPRGFAAALARAAADFDATDRPALIAEIKKASPSKGLIRPDFDPGACARAYAEAGAACLSVLTDGPSFQGGRADLEAARAACALPVLRKDFMVDPYQCAEARAWGADCVLIIMAALDDGAAAEIAAAAREHSLDVLVEVHDAAEADRAARLEARLVGVNNRDLKTFETRLATTAALAPRIPPDRLLVSESGIAARADIDALMGYGAKAFLVGETLMRARDVAAATRKLLGPRTATA
ncbi:MAG: indole-3-glycerol phosphate synthase TrpC [Parvularculaceae bacterium]